jgi:uncharacterized membrane protein YidH (DUF202 family)
MAEEPDRSAAAERTLLAWTRTSIAVAAVGLLVVRLMVADAPVLAAAGFIVAAAAVGLSVASRRRYEWLPVAVAVVSVAVAVLCALTALVRP